MEKYGSELIRTNGKQDDARKVRRKSDVLIDNWKKGRTCIKVRVFLYSLLESPNSDTDKFGSESACTVGKSPSMDPGGYPHQV